MTAKKKLTNKQRVLQVYPDAHALNLGTDPFAPARIQIVGYCRCCGQRLKDPLTIWHPTAHAAWADAARKLK